MDLISLKNTIFLFSFLLITSSMYGQTLTGKVVNKMNQPIPGTHLLNLSTLDHSHCDEHGQFSITEINIGDTLKTSHIGYKLQNIVVTSLEEPLTILLEELLVSLDEIVISTGIDALNIITDIDIQTQPVNSSQDLLRQVPGLFIGQHAGGGKAEQILLRGFDIDHGTDLTISADGLPVNMVSHAHGQGYADLHFLIPETIEEIGFGKGPYYANKGNFNTAGYVEFKTKNKLENNLLKLEAGQFNTQRLLSMFKLLDNEQHHSYVATEYINTDGPFESPQNFNRLNLVAKYTGQVTEFDQVGITLSHFSSKWDASGQIPQRAVDQGLISRFGAIDDTEGGNTSRSNLAVHYNKYLTPYSSIKSQVYYSAYDFELYSNFTFFLEDDVNGDQIKQKESRKIFGINSEFSQTFTNGILKGDWQTGLNIRSDDISNNELSHTLNRNTTLQSIQLGEVLETNLSAYMNANLDFGKWRINPAVRVDYFNFQYNDALLNRYQTQNSTQSIVSPKLNILYNYSNHFQGYLKMGKGFHSNDTRVILDQKSKEALPAAYGYDVGFIWKPSPRLFINAAYWWLFLEQEFVYVGDAGIVEPSGQSQRQGIDLSVRYQVLDYLFWNLDANYTYARSIAENGDKAYIPLAPDFNWVSGVHLLHPAGFFGGAHLRYLKDRPANEDFSIVAKGYTILDLNAGYNWKNLTFSGQIQNLFNTEWNETQFATESRLAHESIPVEEIHFTPGSPFSIKGSIEYKF